MPIRVAINGFGRIGRCLARIIATEVKDVELVAINSRAGAKVHAHLLRHDSVHGHFPGTVEAKSDGLVINGKEVHLTQIDDPEKLLEFSDWMGIPIRPYKINLTRFKRLLIECQRQGHESEEDEDPGYGEKTQLNP